MRAIIGQTGDLFAAKGIVHRAVLAIDSDASGTVELLKPDRRHDALVKINHVSDSPSAIRSICLKLPDAYGTGRDQDFLLVSSGDGTSRHHLALPATEGVETLYSSLWLYLLGVAPTLFGLRVDRGGFTAGDSAEFCISPPVGNFSRVGTLTLGEPVEGDPAPLFAGRNSGGGIRALPPVSSYR